MVCMLIQLTCAIDTEIAPFPPRAAHRLAAIERRQDMKLSAMRLRIKTREINTRVCEYNFSELQ